MPRQIVSKTTRNAYVSRYRAKNPDVWSAVQKKAIAKYLTKMRGTPEYKEKVRLNNQRRIARDRIMRSAFKELASISIF